MRRFVRRTEVVRSVDESDVRERLGKIADEAFGFEIIFLREQPDVIT